MRNSSPTCTGPPHLQPFRFVVPTTGPTYLVLHAQVTLQVPHTLLHTSRPHLQLILDHEARGGHALGEAEGHLQDTPTRDVCAPN